MTNQIVAGKKFYISGFDYTGLSNSAFLKKQGCTLYGWDDDPKRRQKAPKDVVLVPPDEMDWGHIAGLLTSPLGDDDIPQAVRCASSAGVSMVSDIDLLQQAAPEATYIGVTGTSGKSTAVSLVAHLLRSAGFQVEVGGHMGRPALAMPLLGKGGVYILEISSYQLLAMHTFRANIAVLLNLSPNHLNLHETMDAYTATKQKIFNNQTPADTRVLSVDNYELKDMGIGLGLGVPLRRISVTGVGADISATVDGHLLDYDTAPPRFIVNLNSIIPLPGLHNWQNITCAWATVKDMITQEQFLKGLDTFKGVKHRFEHVLCHQHVLFVNDSKATTGLAASRALESAENIFWIAGGEAKEGGIDACMDHLENVRGVYLIGRAAEAFSHTLAGVSFPVYQCKTLQAATKLAYKEACAFSKKQDQKATVLLSPACNSFDQFDSFEHRGNLFVTLAQTLAGHDEAFQAGAGE